MMSQGKPALTIAVKVTKSGLEDEDVEDFLSEIAMMKMVSEGRNAHVVRMIGCVSASLPAALLLEFIPHGNLRGILQHCKPVDCEVDEYLQFENGKEHRREGCDVKVGNVGKDELQIAAPSQDSAAPLPSKLDSNDMVSFAFQIASGMEYLSSLGIIHRDLACRNILVDTNLVLKISDFGLSRSGDEYVSSMRNKLPLRWMAPETFETNLFNEYSDVWSFGVCLWEIHTFGETPYQDILISVVLPRVASGHRLKQPANCPSEVYSIMEKCWSKSPELRPDFNELRTTFETELTDAASEQYAKLI